MRYRLVLLTTLAWSIGFVAANAQTTSPGMGATSPLGMSSDNSSSSLVGGNIPLGATGINTTGVSPLLMPCPSSSSNAAFDGGGSSQSNNCGSSSADSSSGSGSSGVGLGSSGSASASGIPLGATDLGIPGESQVTSVPTTMPCLQSMTQQGSSSGAGLSSSSVNGGC